METGKRPLALFLVAVFLTMFFIATECEAGCEAEMADVNNRKDDKPISTGVDMSIVFTYCEKCDDIEAIRAEYNKE